MFKNYLTVAIRNLMRKKLYTFINVFGLSLGLACCILMTLFVKHEWTHDWFHENHDQIFRIVTQRTQADGKPIPFESFDTNQPLWMVNALKGEIPSILNISAFMQDDRADLITGGQTFQQKVGLVSVDFLTMFTFPMVVGDPNTALKRPDGIVITKEVAHKVFEMNDDNFSRILGQPLTVRKKQFVITGVIENVPSTSTLQFDILISAKSANNFKGMSRNGNHRYASIYIQTTQEQSLVVDALNRWSGKNELGEIIKNSYRAQPGKAFQLALQPLTNVYWNVDMPNLYGSQGNPTTVYILWAFSVLILLIACSNFITLSISESSGRSLEVGLRKVLGANRIQVVKQFCCEALVLSFLGMVLGLVLAELFLPIFNDFVQRNLTIAYVEDSILFCLLFAIVGVLAGSYPAAIVSRFQPISAIKGEVRIGGRNLLTRSLIVLQYTISIALIICTGVMLQQQSYIKNKDLGFNKEEIILIQGGSWEIAQRFKQEALKNPNMMNVTLSDYEFIGGYPGSNFKLPGGQTLPGGKDWVVTLGIDVDYLSTFEIPLLQGRNFSPNVPSDRTNAVLINETMAKLLNFKNPVGETLLGFNGAGLKDPKIIGVIKDTHVGSLHEHIEPQVLQINHFNNGIFTFVRISPNNMAETVNLIKETWHKVAPNVPIQFGFKNLGSRYATLSFVDEILNRKYANEHYWNRILNYSSLLTIMLSCLGLFGLASLAVTRRTKEVGIRKVLGASMSNVMWLLSKDFVKLLLFANIIAWPIAYWAMDKWLANFAYRMELGIGIFLLSGLLTLIIALLTVNVQTLKAARSNPVDALRYE